jgi:tRNA(Ile)-lysidine synthase TilS/MesJ
MRQHKLALCKEHFPQWVMEQTERFIRKYRMFERHERLLVAVSGGKDSLSLWDILWRLGYQADGVYIGLGIDGGISYSDTSQRLTEQFAAQRGLQLHVVDIQEEYGSTIPQIANLTYRGQGKPCSVCGLTKRHVMNRVAHQGAYDVLVTGHNLDDEAAMLLGNTLTWNAGYLLRQAPVLPALQGMARKAKPLCRFYEREMAAYALVSGIEYIYDECPHAAGTKSIYYKGLLNQLEEERPGAKLSFYLSFLQAKENGLFNEVFSTGGEADDLTGAGGVAMHPCPTCGQPTTTPAECAFCRMMAKVTR